MEHHYRAESGLELTRHGTFLGGLSLERYVGILPRLIPLLKAAIAEQSEGTDTRGVLVSLLEAAENSRTSSYLKEKSRMVFKYSHQELHWLLKHNESQWIEYLVYRYKFKIYPYLRKLEKFPVHLLVEPTSVCNLRCVMCFQVDESFNNKEFMGLMDWNLFTKVVDEARDHGCKAITMASRGEPTLHKSFGKMLHYVRDAGILDVKINTNATRLSESLCHDILGTGVSEVVFSVDAATKETYEQIRVRGIFENVVANIERFNDIRNKHYPDSATVTRIAGVKVRDDQDASQMHSFWATRVDQVMIKKAVPRWNSYEHLPEIGSSLPCHLLWERFYVWYDGTLNPCDYDYKSFLKVGNLREMSVAEAWLGDKMTSYRKAHSSNKRASIYPCDRCPLG